MIDLLKKAGSLIGKRIAWWILGLVGFKGIAIGFLIVILIVILIGAFGGASVNQEDADSISSGEGVYTCTSDGEINKSKWENNWEKMGAIKNQGDTVIDVSEDLGIDPVLFASIMAFETGWGSSNAIKNYKNPGGLMDPSTGSQTLYQYSTYEDGIKAMGKTLHNRIIKDGLVTIEDLGEIYAPVGADNDPNGTNELWIPSVKKMSKEFGGLTMNCEKMPEHDFEFDGDASELASNVIKTGSKYMGKPYVWGGARSESGANKGEFDCSSFVYWAYKWNGVDLNNGGGVGNTDTLKHAGKKIDVSDIQVGDLIFWDTYKVDGHVGIYIGNGEFIGSQTSKGVAIEKMDSPYWSDPNVFKGHVRRVIN